MKLLVSDRNLTIKTAEHAIYAVIVTFKITGTSLCWQIDTFAYEPQIDQKFNRSLCAKVQAEDYLSSDFFTDRDNFFKRFRTANW